MADSLRIWSERLAGARLAGVTGFLAITSLGRAMAKRSISTEPSLWALFGARGLLAVLRYPLTCIVLLALRVLALFHWAHRFRYTL